jgi:hypothetical protein
VRALCELDAGCAKWGRDGGVDRPVSGDRWPVLGGRNCLALLNSKR